MEALRLNLNTNYRNDMLSPYGAEMPATDFVDFAISYLNKFRRSKDSFGDYINAVGHFNRYQLSIKTRYKTNDIGCEVLELFHDYLIHQADLKISTANGVVGRIKCLLGKAEKKRWSVDDSYSDMKYPRVRTFKPTLTKNEVAQLFFFDNMPERLIRMKDQFVMQCASSLRYSDVTRLTWDHVNNGFIEMIAQKTKEPLTIPVDDMILRIFKKYEYKLPPFKTHQHFNSVLKDIFVEAKLTRKIIYEDVVKGNIEKIETTLDRKAASHMGRRTFVTLKVEEGWTWDAIRECTGHTSLDMVSRYDYGNAKTKISKMRY